jgi:hypothetical protein
VVVDAEKGKNEREKLFQVKRKKCAQKEFDRADIVRDGRLPRLPGVWAIEMKHQSGIGKKILLHIREIVHQLGLVNFYSVLLETV